MKRGREMIMKETRMRLRKRMVEQEKKGIVLVNNSLFIIIYIINKMIKCKLICKGKEVKKMSENEGNENGHGEEDGRKGEKGNDLGKKSSLYNYLNI